MAYNVNVTAQYLPVTFDEMIKPLSLYKTEYERQEALYDSLLEEAKTLGDLKNSKVDENVYNQYNDFITKLSDAIKVMDTTGKLDSRTFRDLRREYINTLSPYNDKLKLRNALVKEQMKNWTPGTIYDVDYMNTPLDAINEGSYFRTYKTSDIESAAAQTLASKYIADGKYGSEEEDINTILGSLNTTGLSEDKLNTIKASIKNARNSAMQAVETYKLQQELNKASIIQKTRSRGSTGSGGHGSTTELKKRKILDPVSGDYVEGYVDSGGNWYKDSNGDIPVETTTELHNLYNDRKYIGKAGTYEYTNTPNIGKATRRTDAEPSGGWERVITTVAEANSLADENSGLYQDMVAALNTLMGSNSVAFDVGWIVNNYIIRVAESDGATYINIEKREVDSSPEEEESQEGEHTTSTNTTETAAGEAAPEVEGYNE